VAPPMAQADWISQTMSILYSYDNGLSLEDWRIVIRNWWRMRALRRKRNSVERRVKIAHANSRRVYARMYDERQMILATQAGSIAALRDAMNFQKLRDIARDGLP